MADEGRLRVILGSQSKWRRKLLSEAGLVFDCMAADIDEKAVTVCEGDRDRADPTQLTRAIALAKAAALRPCVTTPALLITSGEPPPFNLLGRLCRLVGERGRQTKLWCTMAASARSPAARLNAGSTFEATRQSRPPQ
jgi:hypothetical protein